MGTRLRPFTLHHPKALVPVDGVPMLRIVIENLVSQGFDRVVVNVHHFADQIVGYLAVSDFGVPVFVSDESGQLLDTGGGIVKAASLFGDSEEPVLVHNVDILSNANLFGLYSSHNESGAGATLLCSTRSSSRKLFTEEDGRLAGWKNINTGELKPRGLSVEKAARLNEVSFSGIYVVGRSEIEKMREWAQSPAFPVMDYFLDNLHTSRFICRCDTELRVMDIGKPETLSLASGFRTSLK